jgi:hypothetical protein
MSILIKTLAAIAAGAALAASTLAQSEENHHIAKIAAAPRSLVTVDRNDPTLTGGGSLGYNQMVERGY